MTIAFALISRKCARALDKHTEELYKSTRESDPTVYSRIPKYPKPKETNKKSVIDIILSLIGIVSGVTAIVISCMVPIWYLTYCLWGVSVLLIFLCMNMFNKEINKK